MEVLVSPGFGAGFSTWNEPEMAIDKRLIEKFKTHPTAEEFEQFCIECGYGITFPDGTVDVCMLGYGDLEIQTVPAGALFKVCGYDGHEYIEIADMDNGWFVAD